MTRRLALSFVSLLAAAPTLVTPTRTLADGFIYVPDGVVVLPRRVVPPRPPRRPPRPHFPMQVTRHRVTVEIDDTLVHTRVEETFFNPNSAQLEGVYLFPMPPGAAVSNFRMKMGGKEVAGEILEKDEARRIYEQIVRQVRDPGLLEYVDRGLFRARVFPIPPRGGVDVTIEYSESLSRTAGHTEYRYPLDTGKYSSGDYRDVVIDVRLRSTRAIRSVHCPSHEVSLSRHGDREVRVGFEAKTLQADKDFLLQWNVGEDALAPLLVTHRGHEKDGFFYLAIAPRPDASKPTPKDVVFVIDTSGSMSGRKIEQVKRALRYGLNSLNDGDRFDIIDFSTEARRFRGEVVAVSQENRRQAEDYVDQLKARGGTNIEEGLRFALESAGAEGRLQLIVLLTDGEPTIGVTRPAELVKGVRDRNKKKRRIFVFGVGEDLNAKLLDLLVLENRGASQYIRSQENIEVPLSNFFDKVDSPLLTGLRLEVRGGTLSSVYPKPLPDLFKGEQLDVFGRYDTDGHKTLVLTGRYLGTDRVFEYSLEFKGKRNDHLPGLWAVRKIGHLLEEMRLNGESKEVKEEVIRLSKLHGVLTPYTSYLILEEDRLAGAPVPRPGTTSWRYRSAARDALSGGRAGNSRGASSVELRAVRLLREKAADGAEAFGADVGAKAVEFSRQLGLLKIGKMDKTTSDFLRQEVHAAGVRVRKAGGKTFYLQDKRWIDAALTTTELQDSERLRRVKYLSDEYFALLTDHPAMGKLLSVGAQVSFLWKGQLISVVE
ncbi:MAG: VIT domain-containing protein [Planctomycetota bacterium]|nr:VIT domain-containing protein [Planctomycetota bacterium]